MIVGIAATVTFLLHQPGRRVEDVLRREQRAALLRRMRGKAEGDVARVRFRRGGEIDRGLRQRELAFGRPQKVVSLLGSDRLYQSVWIGKADVLDGHTH